VRWLVFAVLLSACDKGVDCTAVLAKAEPVLKQLGTGNTEYKQLRDRCHADASDPLVRCVAAANGEDAIGACFGASRTP
jgi:hypothetical protein